VTNEHVEDKQASVASVHRYNGDIHLRLQKRGEQSAGTSIHTILVTDPHPQGLMPKDPLPFRRLYLLI